MASFPYGGRFPQFVDRLLPCEVGMFFPSPELDARGVLPRLPPPCLLKNTSIDPDVRRTSLPPPPRGLFFFCSPSDGREIRARSRLPTSRALLLRLRNRFFLPNLLFFFPSLFFRWGWTLCRLFSPFPPPISKFP